MRYQKNKGDKPQEDLSKWPDKVQQSTESFTSEECNEATPDQVFCRWLHQIWTISNNVTSRLKYLLRVSPSSRTSSSDESLETNGDESSSNELTTLNDDVETEEESIRHHDRSAYGYYSPCGHRIPHGHLCVPGLPYGNDGSEEHRVIEESNLRSSEIKLPGNVFLRNSGPRPVLVLPRIRHENNGPRMYIPEVFQHGIRTDCRYHNCETRRYPVYWNEYDQARQRRMEDLVGYQIPDRLSPTSLKPKSEVNVDRNDYQKMTNFSNYSTKLNVDVSDVSTNLTCMTSQNRISEGSSIQSNRNLKNSFIDAKSQKNGWDSRLSDIPSQDPSSNDNSKDGLSLKSSLHSVAEENISVKNKNFESHDIRRGKPEKNVEINIEDEKIVDSLKVNVIDSKTNSKTQNQIAASNELCQEKKFSLTAESCFDTLLTSLRAKMNTLNAETHLNGIKLSTSVITEKVKRPLSSMTDPNVDNINCTLEKYSKTVKECKVNCEDIRPTFSERIQDIWHDSSKVSWNSFYKEEPLKLISNERKEPAKMSIFGLKKQSNLGRSFGEYGTAIKLANILEAMTELKAGESASQISRTLEEPQWLLPDETKSKIHVGIQYSSSALAIEDERSCRNEKSKGYEIFDNKLVNLSHETPRSLQIFTEHSILPGSTVEIKPLTHQIQSFAQYHQLFPHKLKSSMLSSDGSDLSKKHSITMKSPVMQDATDMAIPDYKLKKYEWLPQNIKVPPSGNYQMLVQENISTRIRSWLFKNFHQKRSNANLPVGQRFKRIRPHVINKKVSNLLKHIKRKGKLRNELKETHIFEKFPKRMPIPPVRKRRKRFNTLNKQNFDAVLKNVILPNSTDNIKSINKECANINSTSTNNINNESNLAKNITEETHVSSSPINITSSKLSIKESVMNSSSQKNIMDQVKCINETDLSNNQNTVPMQLNVKDSFSSPDKSCLKLETEVTEKMSFIDTMDDLRTSKLEMRQDIDKINSSSRITNSSPRIADSYETIKVPSNNSTTDTSINCTISGLDNKRASLDKKEFYRKKYQFLSKQIIKKKELYLKPPEAKNVESKILVEKKEMNINSIIQDDVNHKSGKEQPSTKYKSYQNSYKRTNNVKSKCFQSLSLINEVEPLNENIVSSLNSNSRISTDNVTSLNKSYRSEVTKVQLISCGNEVKDTTPEMNKNLIPIKEYKMENQSTQSYVSYNNKKRNLQAKRSLSKVEVKIPITSIKSQDKDLSYGSSKVANNSVQPCLDNKTESKRITTTDPCSISQEISQNKQTEKALVSNYSRSPVASNSIATRVNRRNLNENKLMYLSRIKKKLEESRNTKLSITKEIKAESDVVLQMSNDNCTTTEKRNKSIGYALLEEGLCIPENSGFLGSTKGNIKISKTRSQYKATKILERLMQVSEKVESTMVKNLSSEKIESTKSKEKSESRYARSVLYSSGNLKKIPLDDLARKTIMKCSNTNREMLNDNIRSVK